MGRTIIAAVFPIGIDVEAFAAMAHTAEANERIERLHRRAVPRVHIIGVDRLDYTKGLPERLRAFWRLLELYPENQKIATLMQIAAPIARGCRGLCQYPPRAGATLRRNQWRIRRFRLDARPLYPSVRWKRYPGSVSGEACRSRHPAARRNEPGRQGICCCAGRA
jgi:Glycosyltransferase family 20